VTEVPHTDNLLVEAWCSG